MIGFSGNAKYVLLGVALLGLATPTSASSQQMPDEIKLARNAVNIIMHDVDNYVATLVSKCDKCDSSSKSGSQKAVVTLRRAIADLEKITNEKYIGLAKASK
jgi:hypothetical protein